jgi:hypothetical protein
LLFALDAYPPHCAGDAAAALKAGLEVRGSRRASAASDTGFARLIHDAF